MATYFAKRLNSSPNTVVIDLNVFIIGQMDLSSNIDAEPLYNIRLIKGYVEYLERNYPDIDIQSVLDYSGISPYEYNDLGFWFSQQQADLFYACVLQKTANPNIAREAGRMGATATSYTAFRQYAFGFVTPAIAYGVIAKLAMTLTRGGTFATKRVDSSHIEVIATPAADVNEKPYQCENRLGILEAIACHLQAAWPRSGTKSASTRAELAAVTRSAGASLVFINGSSCATSS